MRKNTIVSLALSVLILVPMAVAAKGPRLKPELRKEVQTTFKRLQKDPVYQAMKGRLKGHVLDRAVVESYLSYLPVSPLEIFNLDRWTRRIDMPVPEVIEAYHERWKQLHPAEARRFYGAGPRRGAEGIAEEKLLADDTTKSAVIGTNLNLAHTFPVPPQEFQSEVQVVVNPNNPNQMVAAANTAKVAGACGPRTVQAIYYSSDGGATWGLTCAPSPIQYGLDCDALGGIVNGSDPALAWNRNNEVFFNYMAICFNGDLQFAMVIARSTDGGATWSARGTIKNSWPTLDVEDKNFLAIDTHQGSPYSGRLYSCWGRNNDEKIAYSSDNGLTWTEKDLPTPPNGGVDISCDIAVQKNGTVHVVIETESCNDVECFDEWLYYTRSTDGGATWSAPKLVAATNFAGFSANSCPAAQDGRCIIGLGSIDVDNSGGLCNGTVYVTYGDHAANASVDTMDVFVRRSTNGGSTWGSAVRVNDDGAGGRVQFYPTLTVDQVKGHPVVAWLDARNDPGNASVDVFTSRSITCGQSFRKNVQVTKPSSEFNNSTISYSNESVANAAHNINQFGDYIGLDARNGEAYVAWTDSRHFFPAFQTEPQKENIAFAKMTFGPPSPSQSLQSEIVSQRVQISWRDSPEAADLTSYNVYRVSGGVYTKVGSLAVSGYSPTATRSFRDTTTPLSTARTSFYAVAGVDSLGEEGPYSSLVSAASQ
ncbi:MAG TPA: sialidase family protein [Thermoanaerobaculia bacterium]|nr:sialidase family protein [Thermoanaerobaculia bacterium]